MTDDEASRMPVGLPLGLGSDEDLYAGKWVAVVHGHIAGVGETAREARAFARRNWPRDEAVVLLLPAKPEGMAS
jgi:hypothetical protein